MRGAVILSLVLMICCPVASFADDVTDQIDEALKAYKKKDYPAAASALDTAAALIRQKRADSLTGLLPKPLSGWQADDAETSHAGAAMLGGGISAQRRYHKEEKEVTVSITADSPMLQAINMMFTNPQFSGPGAKLVVIGGRKAIYNTDDNSLQAMVADRILVSVEGRSGADKGDVEGYFKAVDFAALEKMMK